MSTAFDVGGSRASIYYDKQLGGGPVVGTDQLSGHITGMFTTTAGGDVLPPMYIFKADSLNIMAVDGLPSVRNPHTGATDSATFVCNETGSMTTKEFPGFVESVAEYYGTDLAPKFEFNIPGDPESGVTKGPIYVQLDSGPGRIVCTRESVHNFKAWAARGIHIFLGIPNGTAVNQPMDQLYGVFKQLLGDNARYMRQKKDTAARKAREASTKIPSTGFTYSDLPEYQSGDKSGKMKDAFSLTFTRTKIRNAYKKTGTFPPCPRPVYDKNEKLRNDDNDRMIVNASGISETLSDIILTHNTKIVQELNKAGLDGNAFSVVDNRLKSVTTSLEKEIDSSVAPTTTSDKIRDARKLTAGTYFVATGGSMHLNGKDTVAGIEARIDVEEADANRIANKKLAAKAKLLNDAKAVNDKIKDVPVGRALADLKAIELLTLVKFSRAELDRQGEPYQPPGTKKDEYAEFLSGFPGWRTVLNPLHDELEVLTPILNSTCTSLQEAHSARS
jgi:hypothetical protein